MNKLDDIIPLTEPFQKQPFRKGASAQLRSDDGIREHQRVLRLGVPSAGWRFRSEDDMTMTPIFRAGDGEQRLARLLAKRMAEDERLVCLQRAEILQTARLIHAHLPRVQCQAAVIRDLCQKIAPIIEPEDLIVGRMPEILPDEKQEGFIDQYPELFSESGLPGVLDSMFIYVPDWAWLVERGLGGIAQYAQHQLGGTEVSECERGFLSATIHAMESVSCLIRRYAEEARRLISAEPSLERRLELETIADRCDRVAWDAPSGFIEALQLIQIVHMSLSCLVGGRDVTPGRVDQYLLGSYQRDIADGAMSRDDAVILLAMFFLRLSQMGGHGTDFDDNVRRSPCMYTHLYVTVGGTDIQGNSCVNELSFVVADAIRMLNYKEPTLLLRYHAGMDQAFAAKVVGLVRERLPVTIYNDVIVIQALIRQSVPAEMAHEYAFSACHNSIIPGHEAGSGPGGFYNVPHLMVLAMNAGRDPKTGEMLGVATANPFDIRTFEQFLNAFRAQIRHQLDGVRKNMEARWQQNLSPACPLLQSCLMKECLDRRKSVWQAATVSHMNHYLMGLATSVDSLLAVRRLVFVERCLEIGDFVRILTHNWSGHAALRNRIRKRLPRYGQDHEEVHEMISWIGRMWVEEVETASTGLTRMAMWPGFYSHMLHVHEGARTMATPDGRMDGEPLSENLAPSSGSPGCSPTSILKAMSRLPFTHTPSGAAILSLSNNPSMDGCNIGRLLSILKTYFAMGGLHLQVNLLDAATLRSAIQNPELHENLMVRVAGFSAYFTHLSRQAQQDVVRRHGGEA